MYNKISDGVQCTAAVHVDDLIITSVNQGMIDGLCSGLELRYGEITRQDGPVLNYLGMVFDLSVVGEVRMSMKGYTDDTPIHRVKQRVRPLTACLRFGMM